MIHGSSAVTPNLLQCADANDVRRMKNGVFNTMKDEEY
ncbi:hypothetical protein T4B_14239 [Trichinella pseudospiralis]|uniref:Uncharacterized protein n=1 Tax=Trichinella pseudospiralis TaxID=6337 RepID=A0A0V1GQF4_TRIPS|nr:hypothetical protein T4B_14239 [Trichinella pseudospiralis]